MLRAYDLGANGGRQLNNVLEFGRQSLVLDIYLHSRCIVSFPK